MFNTMHTGTLFLCTLLQTLNSSHGFQMLPVSRGIALNRCDERMTSSSLCAETDEEDIDFLFEEVETPFDKLDGGEKAWRYAKKTLLRIGAKGATLTHGNSLRQLLEDHTVVKVKVNIKTFGTLEAAFEKLRELAEENGAPKNIELIQARKSEKTIMLGMPGTLDRIKVGEFPPAPVVYDPEANKV